MITILLRIIFWWVVLSCTLGPCLTWVVFYRKRQARLARQHWRETHSTTSPAQMPVAISGLSPVFSEALQ